MSASDPVDALAPTRRADVKVLRDGEDPMIGREVIGQYRIEKRLGAGGMGAVYLAQQITVARPAVIKVLRSQFGGGLDLAARFDVEARAASKLNHPNIVTIYNYGEMEDGTLFLAMEYLAGETLARRIERCGQLSADRAVHIAAQIASALGEAHARGVVHRDLKPSNVMLVERAGEPDFVKVLDFGIAKLDGTGITSVGDVFGTPRYMSPEQLRGQRLDRRSDIYSMGIVLYEMLAGRTPFHSETPMGWMYQHVDVEPKPPSALSKGGRIPAPLERVVLRSLAKDPSDRPSSMEVFARELDEASRAPRKPSRLSRAVVSLVRFLAACVLVLGSGTRRFARVLVSRSWRMSRAIGSGTWRFVRAIGSGTRRLVRALGSRIWRFARAIGSGTRRLARVIGSWTRRLVLAPPTYLVRLARRCARVMLATNRRRAAVVMIAVIAAAMTSAVALPSKVDGGLWSIIGKSKSTRADRSKGKPSRASPHWWPDKKR